MGGRDESLAQYLCDTKRFFSLSFFQGTTGIGVRVGMRGRVHEGGGSPKTNGPLISGMSFYLFLQLRSLGASCLPSFPARVNTPAPAGVWNLLSLCQLGTWRWVRLKECVMSEGVGDRGCIYTEGVCRGQ